MNQMIFFRYTPYGLKSMLKDAGLEVLIFEPLGGMAEAIIGIFAKVIKHATFFGKYICIAIQQLVLGFKNLKIWNYLQNKQQKFSLRLFAVAKKKWKLFLKKQRSHI